MKSVALIVALSVMLVGCGEPLTVHEDRGGVTYPTYGLFNENSPSGRSTNVCYEVSVGNVVWSIILIETVIIPVYFIGWSLYNPVRLKKGPDDQCHFDG